MSPFVQVSRKGEDKIGGIGGGGGLRRMGTGRSVQVKERKRKGGIPRLVASTDGIPDISRRQKVRDTCLDLRHRDG